MIKKSYISSILLASLLLMGCSQQNTKLNRKKIDIYSIDKKSVNNIVKSNNQFAFALYSNLKDKNTNLFFSPYSINSALMLLLLGADGKTESDMRNALYLNVPNANAHYTFAALSDKLSSANLSIANSLWPSKDNNLEDLYLKNSISYYGAKPITLDYKNNLEKSRKTINSWVEKITHDKIKDLVPKGSIDDITKMVITNAIYFKGMWSEPFKKSQTKEGDFKLESGKTIKVKFMQKESKLPYYEDAKIQAVKLSYKKGLSMMLIKPKNGILSLDNNYYDKIFHSLGRKKVFLKIPKFKIETPSMSLVKPLSEIGMSVIFNSANFSKLSKNQDLKVDDVLHKAYIKVDEEGTVAAAATAIIAVSKSISMVVPQKPIPMILDSKFTFMIVDDLNGEIIFLGDVSKPEE